MESCFEIEDEYDKELSYLILEIEEKSKCFAKSDILKIDAWCRKFCEITSNLEWKKNRNLHGIYLLDMIMNKRISDPYNKFPKGETLPMLNKALVKSTLSGKLRELDFTHTKINILNENNLNNQENNNIPNSHMIKGNNENVEMKNIGSQKLLNNNLNKIEQERRSPSPKRLLNNSFQQTNKISNKKTSNDFSNSVNNKSFNNSKRFYKSIPIHKDTKKSNNSLNIKDFSNQLIQYQNLISELTLDCQNKDLIIKNNNIHIEELKCKLNNLKTHLESLLLNKAPQNIPVNNFQK